MESGNSYKYFKKNINILTVKPAVMLDELLQIYSLKNKIDTGEIKAIIHEAKQDHKKNIVRESKYTELLNTWEAGIRKGEKNYYVYDDEYYLVDIWLCWEIYSRKYVREIEKPGTLKTGEGLIDLFNNVSGVLDLGCGLGLTAAAFTQIFKDRYIVGTNIEGTKQYEFCKTLSGIYGFNMAQSPKEVKEKIDLIFASEYFEHIESPIQHLRDVLEAHSASYLYIANSFTGRAIGHFPEYENGTIKNTDMQKEFDRELMRQGYRKIKTNIWNNRPSLYERVNNIKPKKENIHMKHTENLYERINNIDLKRESIDMDDAQNSNIIPIKCTGSDNIPFSELKSFQGKLKTISRDNLEKLKKSIISKGFIAPPFIWNSPEGFMILDGHQRIKALKELEREGWECPEIPVVFIAAATEKDAREKLLHIASQYGDFDLDEVESWLSELDDDIDITIRLMEQEFERENEAALDGPSGTEESIYTNKIKAPIYEITGERPEISTLVDHTKTMELIAEIEEAGIVDQEIKAFLTAAAQRHSIFNYKAIAEYYAHADKAVQLLMEKSALVIIDFNKAIEYGFVELSKGIAEAYSEDEGMELTEYED